MELKNGYKMGFRILKIFRILYLFFKITSQGGWDGICDKHVF